MNEFELTNFEEVWRRVTAAEEPRPVPEPVPTAAPPRPAPPPHPMRFLPEM